MPSSMIRVEEPGGEMGTMEVIAQEAGKLLQPLIVAGQSENVAYAMVELLSEAGWSTESVANLPALESLGSAARSASAVINTLAGSSSSGMPDWQDSFASIRDVTTAITRLDDSAAGMGKSLLTYLVAKYLRYNHNGLFSWLSFLGVIRQTGSPDPRYDFNLAAIGDLISDPRAHFASVYGWNGDFNGQLLLDRIAPLLNQLGIQCQFEFTPDENRTALGLDADPDGPEPELRISLLRGVADGSFAELGIRIVARTAEVGPEIAFIPYGAGAFSQSVEIGSDWDLGFQADAEAQSPHAVALHRSGFDIVPLGDTGSVTNVAFNLDLRKKRGGAGKPFIKAGGSEVSVGQVGVHVAAKYGIENEVSISIPANAVRILIAAGEDDGFLKKVLPKDGIETTFDLEIGWNSKGGLFFRGSARLEATFPVHKTIGPVALESIYAAIETGENRALLASVAVTGSITLGPVAASVERIGITIPVAFRDGNLGPIDIGQPRFLPPLGAGISMQLGDAGKIGGFVLYDPDAGRYAGVLEGKFGDIGIVAVGIITTKNPGQSEPSYSLFVSVSITFSPVITLPYNFCISGFGGFCALGRRMDVDALRSGLKNKTLSSLFFQTNPIANASKMFSDIDRSLPQREGSAVIAPAVRLCWSKDIIVADIAIAFEFPAPYTIALLGKITANFPRPDNAVVLLHLDILGVLDTAKKEFSLDATLYDSKIVKYELYGDAAMRLSYGSRKSMALSVGGFHPRFDPPPKFPKLRRLTLELSSSNSFELTGKVYHALTSNSLQFGASISLHAECSGAELDARISIDGLVIFNPFEFEFSFDARASASYKGHDVCSFGVSGKLCGPTPWCASGRFSFSVLAWDVKGRFSKEWGSDNRASVPAVDPTEQFLLECARTENWGPAMLPKRSAVESLKSVAEPAEGDSHDLLAHPATSMEFRQRLLPLGIKLEKLGAAKVKTHDTFDVELHFGPPTLPAGAPPFDTSDVRDYFARGQCKELSKADQMSTPAFELFKMGKGLVPRWSRIDGLVVGVELEYESILIAEDGVSVVRAVPGIAPWLAMRRTLGLLRGLNVHLQGAGKFMVDAPPRVDVLGEAHSVVFADSMVRSSIYPSSAGPLNYTEARDLADTAIAGSVMVVPDFEETAA